LEKRTGCWSGPAAAKAGEDSLEWHLHPSYPQQTPPPKLQSHATQSFGQVHHPSLSYFACELWCGVAARRAARNKRGIQRWRRERRSTRRRWSERQCHGRQQWGGCKQLRWKCNGRQQHDDRQQRERRLPVGWYVKLRPAAAEAPRQLARPQPALSTAFADCRTRGRIECADEWIVRRGTPSQVSGSDPWIWTCTGVEGGATASCSACLGPTVITASTAGASSWAAAKAKQAPVNELPGEFTTPYAQSLSTLAWEDGIYISRDGLNLYATYIPMDLLKAVLDGVSPTLFYLYRRGPTLAGQVFPTNISPPNPWLHADVAIAQRSATSVPFTSWCLVQPPHGHRLRSGRISRRPEHSTYGV